MVSLVKMPVPFLALMTRHLRYPSRIKMVHHSWPHKWVLASGAGARPSSFLHSDRLFDFQVMHLASVCTGHISTFNGHGSVGCNGQAAWCILTMFKKILQPFEQSLAGVLSSSGFKMKPGKCRIFQNKVPFLGHIVSESGIVTDPMKTEQIANWPLPTTCQVQQFSGLANYYWRVILGFAQIAKPLYHLTEKNMPFKWTSGCQDAFETLQCKLVTAPILGFLGLL